jgi:hypothetical protein
MIMAVLMLMSVSVRGVVIVVLAAGVLCTRLAAFAPDMSMPRAWLIIRTAHIDNDQATAAARVMQ